MQREEGGLPPVHELFKRPSYNVKEKTGTDDEEGSGPALL